MEISIKNMLLLGSVILTGLSAGIFFAWSVSVIPGIKLTVNHTYLETMQSINREILNPVFYCVFFGSLVLLSIASINEFHSNKVVFGLLLAAAITYMLGTVLVTGLGNVPLNDQLEALKLAEIDVPQIEQFRKFYETNWNKLHLIRTLSAVCSFIIAAIALYVQVNETNP
jgi:uncharacterized membrane protein